MSFTFPNYLASVELFDNLALTVLARVLILYSEISPYIVFQDRFKRFQLSVLLAGAQSIGRFAYLLSPQDKYI